MTQATHPAPSVHPWRLTIASLLVVLAAIAVTAVIVADDRTPPTTAVERPADVAAQQQDVAVYARAHGMTGLSPAGMAQARAPAVQPVDADVAQTYRDVARYATAHGLTGLSPAGMQSPAESDTPQ